MIDKNKNYSLSELENLLYSAANTFHAGGDLSNLEILNVAIPTMFLKRVLDLREDYIQNTLRQTKEYDFGGALDALKNHYKTINKAFNVKNNDEWFFVSYKDIINFPNNDKEEELIIRLHIDPTIEIKTTAANRVKFVEEIYNNINHKTVQQIFTKSRYFSLYLNDKLEFNESNILLNKFANHHFGENVKTDMFSQAYIYLISKFASSAGKKGGEFFTPDPICKLVVACLKPKIHTMGKTKIADITSGSATFLIEFGNHIAKMFGKEVAVHHLDFYMQEKESQSLILGEAGLMLAGFENLTAYHGDTLLKYNGNIGQHRGQMDYVVGNPPYGAEVLQSDSYNIIKQMAKDEYRWGCGMPPKGELEWFFVQTALDMIREDGKVGLVLPLGTLFKKNSRKIMIEQDIVEGIIVLPDTMFQTTGIPTCIWIFNKNKEEKDKGNIFMVNASEDFTKEGKYKTINYNRVVDNYTNRKEEDGFSRYIDFDEIKSNEFNLSAQRYVFKVEEKDVVDIEKLNQESIRLSRSVQEQENSLNAIFDMIDSIKGDH